MNYATGQTSAINQGYAGAGVVSPQLQPTPPRTIASAIGRIDGLNDRLAKVRESLASIADQIGGPRPVSESANKPAQAPPSNNAVSRLNESADYAHDYLSEIESLLGSIGRALG